jgi:hypothetical protein
MTGASRCSLQPEKPTLDPRSDTLARDIAQVDPPRPGPRLKWPGMLFWKRQARTWHWMSGAICLVGMLLFAATGITLNHAQDIPASPRVVEHQLVLSAAALEAISPEALPGNDSEAPPVLQRELRRELGVDLSRAEAELTDVDVYFNLPRPGGDAWLSIDRYTGEVLYEVTSRGGIAYVNDLHKGRNTGAAWSWFIDVFAVACIVFCATGLWLLQMHAGRRGSTWFLVGGGFAVPILLLVLFVHS